MYMQASALYCICTLQCVYMCNHNVTTRPQPNCLQCVLMFIYRFVELPDEWSPPVKTDFVEIVSPLQIAMSIIYCFFCCCCNYRVTCVRGCSMTTATISFPSFTMVVGITQIRQRFATILPQENRACLSERCMFCLNQFYCAALHNYPEHV